MQPLSGESVRVIAHQIKKGYTFPPGLDRSVADLIQKLFVVEPSQRLTISQIKVDPTFRVGLPDEYVVPSPLPLPKLHERI